MRKKVTVVGAGFVGSTAALELAEKDIADIILIDILDGQAEGKALDLIEAAPLGRYDSSIKGFTNDYSTAAGSDIVIITAGRPRKPGMSRDDLLSTNMTIMRSVVKEVAAAAPDSILIIVTNPLDVMCHLAFEISGFPKERVIGMAGVLDSTRFAVFIAMELDVSVENVHTLVMGGHGDTMVPLPRYTTVAGIPLTDFLPPERIKALVERTRNAGTEIVELLKTGSAYYASAYAIAEMTEVILRDKNKILPCTVYLEGEYGINNLFLGVPVKLGVTGIKEIIGLKLNDEEMKELKVSADAVKRVVDNMEGMLRANNR